ncbi:MAG TPA: hypothetical protein EYH49_01005 [Aquifex aeolicus]|nr:hypothetical protein [Aquifex aeolicus]
MELILFLVFPLLPITSLYTYLMREYAGLRIYAMVIPPLIGFILLAGYGNFSPPAFITHWGALTSLLYAFRSISVRDLRLWLGYNYVSFLSLQWILIHQGSFSGTLLFLSVAPMLSLALVIRFLEKSVGGAHLSSIYGLGSSSPRLALVMVLSILACAVVPPGAPFVAYLSGSFLTPLPFLGWFLWGWSAVNVISGFLFGERSHYAPMKDMDGGSFSLSLLGVALSLGTGLVLLEATR